MTAWNWPPSSSGGGGGGGGGTASELDTTGAPVDVSGAAPPVTGQVLTALDATHAVWRVPGLHYDPAIKFNVDSLGQATIEPGTWGFVYTTPVSATEIDIFVVSSLAAPPVDSRFGLYVSPSVTLPVIVSLIGASQIMALDGTLGTTVTLLPGAMYEWIFYHESGSAIWGLVSDTAHIGKRLVTATGYVDISAAAAPEASQVLTALSPTTAAWFPASGDMTVDALSAGISGAQHVDLVAHAAVTIPSTVVDGVNVANKRVLLTAQTTVTDNRVWLVSSTGEWNLASGQPFVDQYVLVDDGTTAAGEIWVHFDTDVYVRISIPTPIVAGAELARVGNTLQVVHYKAPCTVVARTSLTLSGIQLIDGTTGVAGSRVLCTAQGSGAANGIYIMSAGAWSRAPDADSGSELDGGTIVPVSLGTTGGQTLWMQTQTNTTVGTSSFLFVQMSTSASALKVGGVNTVTTPTAQPTQGQVMVATSPSASSWQTVQAPSLNGFRLSGDSVAAVTPDGTYSSVFAVATTSNQICLWQGANWQMYSAASSVTLAISGRTAGRPFDVFAAPNVSTFTLEFLDWTDATTRATALTKKDGVWVKSSDVTRRYLGTILPDSSTTFTQRANGTGGTRAICGLWNQDNRLRFNFSWQATGTALVVATPNAWLPYGSIITPHLEIMIGNAEDDAVITGGGGIVTLAGGSAYLGIGIDSTSTPSVGVRTAAGASNTSMFAQSSWPKPLAAGRRTISLLVYTLNSTNTFAGAESFSTALTGLSIALRM